LKSKLTSVVALLEKHQDASNEIIDAMTQMEADEEEVRAKFEPFLPGIPLQKGMITRRRAVIMGEVRAGQSALNEFEKRAIEQMDGVQNQIHAETAEGEAPDPALEDLGAIRTTVTDKMSSLRSQLALASLNTERVALFRHVERFHRAEELRAFLELETAERKTAILDGHESRVATMRQVAVEFRETTAIHMEQLETGSQRKLEHNRQVFESHMEDLHEQHRSLNVTATLLDREMEKIMARICDSCVVKKAKVRKLLEKRDSLRESQELMEHERIQNESKMDSIFQPGTIKVPTYVSSPILAIQSARKTIGPITQQPLNARRPMTPMAKARTGSRPNTATVNTVKL
jgi:hypothetical protein